MSEPKLTLIDSIRKRPGMYLGELSILGLKAMIAYLFDEVVENISGKTEISVEFREEDWIAIRIENFDTSPFVENLQELGSEEISFRYLGLPVIIALSEHAQVHIQQKSSILSLNANYGKYDLSTSIIAHKVNSLSLAFKIDKGIFKEVIVDYEVINQVFRKYAMIHNNCRIISQNRTTSPEQTILFDYPKGIAHFLNYKIGEQVHSNPIFRLDFQKNLNGYEYQISMAYIGWITPTYIMTYANCTELVLGGSLEQGILDGMKTAFKQYAVEKQITIETNKIKEELVLVGVAKGNNFNFEGATKLKLGMPKMKKEVSAFVSKQVLTYLMENDKAGQLILKKFEKME